MKLARSFTLAQADALQRSTMARVVQQSLFWRAPGLVATTMEKQAAQQAAACATELEDARARKEESLASWWRWQEKRGIPESKKREVARKRAMRQQRAHTRAQQGRGKQRGGGAGKQRGRGAGAPGGDSTIGTASEAKGGEGDGGNNRAAGAPPGLGLLTPAAGGGHGVGREECFTVYD